MIRRMLLIGLLLALSGVASAAPRHITLFGRNDLRFSKTHLTVTAGRRVTVTLFNHSDLPPSAMSHNWVLLERGTDAGAFAAAARAAAAHDYIPRKWRHDIIAHTGLVGGGQQSSVTFTAPEKPGHYEYICSFPGHFQAGMKGTLTVRAASK